MRNVVSPAQSSVGARVRKPGSLLRPLSAVVFLSLCWCLVTGVEADTPTGDYAQACRDAIGDIPEFSCASGEMVPVTVDGVPVTPVPGQACDRPALLDNGPGSDGQCVPNSRILSLSTPKMQVAVMCRQKKIRPPGSLLFDEIDVVAHNPVTGATCWFQALPKPGEAIDGTKVASPTSTTSDAIWEDAQHTADEKCGVCHDADPFMYSPFVGQVWKVMPTDPFGPYFHVDPKHYGFEDWPTKSINPADNTCVGCHRLGTGNSCGQLTRWMSGLAPTTGADGNALRFPLSHGMPPAFSHSEESWNEIYMQSVHQVLSCCEDPSQHACKTRPIARVPGR